MTDVKSLLNKRKFTGYDLGRIEITNMALSFKDALEGKTDAIPFIDINKLLSLINALDRKELKIYNNFVEVHDWITMKYNIAQSNFQQAQLQLKIINDFLTDILLTEEFLSYIEKIQVPNKPPVPEMIKETSIKAFFEESTEFETSTEQVISSTNAFYANYYLLTGYNTALDLIADEYGIPDIAIFKRDFTKLHSQIEMINQTRANLYNKISADEYLNDTKLKNRKLNVLDKYFPPIDISDIKIEKDKTDKAKILLKDFKAFKIPAQDPLYSILFIK